MQDVGGAAVHGDLLLRNLADGDINISIYQAILEDQACSGTFPGDLSVFYQDMIVLPGEILCSKREGFALSGFQQKRVPFFAIFVYI